MIHGRYFSRRHPYKVEVYEHRAVPTTSKTASPREKLSEPLDCAWITGKKRK